MTKSEILHLLQDTKSFTIQCFDLSDNELNKTYGEGKWNVRQILHHLTDTEYLFAGRLKKIIAEPKQVIWAFNQDDWNKAFDYLNEPLTGKKELYSICREMNYKLIEKYYDEYNQKEFVHNETGLRTLQIEFEKVALHNKSHNVQMKIALQNQKK
ncbi:MAG: DinB family protein [Saprospiraceae bacterium]|nr:DinB family protein [Saprospiraceae bacterium]